MSGLSEVSVFLRNEMSPSYFRWNWAIKCKRGNNKNAGKVIRLNVPKTSKTPSIADERIDERSCSNQLQNPVFCSMHTGLFTILCINTKHHRTTIVSTLLLKVCV